LLPVLPTYITSELSLNYFQYTFFILIVFGLVAFSMTVLSRGLDTYSMRLTFAVICGGFFIYAAGIIWFSTLETIWLIFAIASFIGLSYGIMLPAWNKYLAGTIEEGRRAESWGVISSVQGIGAMIGPALGGLTADFFGTVDATLLASGLIFVLLFFYYAALFAFRWRRTYKPESPFGGIPVFLMRVWRAAPCPHGALSGFGGRRHAHVGRYPGLAHRTMPICAGGGYQMKLRSFSYFVS